MTEIPIECFAALHSPHAANQRSRPNLAGYAMRYLQLFSVIVTAFTVQIKASQPKHAALLHRFEECTLCTLAQMHTVHTARRHRALLAS